MKKILSCIIKIILSAAVIVNLILTILIFQNNKTVQKDINDIEWDISSIQKNINDINDSISDIEDDVSDIKYYLY